MFLKEAASRVVTIFVAIGAATLGSGAVLQDPSFEESDGARSSGWILSDASFRVERGAGHNGSRGLVWESSTPTERIQGARQEVTLEKGREYRFSVLVETQDFKPGDYGACICLEWYDSAGRFLGGAYVHRGIKERSVSWAMLESSTGRLPANAARMYIQMYVGAGSSGRVAFDEVTLAPRDPPPVAYVVSSRYRDQAVDGRVDFSAAVYPPYGTSLKDVSAAFSYEDVSGVRRKVKAELLEPGVARAGLDVLRMAYGPNPVSCDLMDVRGRVLGTASCTFERLRRMPMRRVWIDAHNRCIVDGKPFFPLGMYSGTIGHDWLKDYAKGPFNCIASYGKATRERLDWCYGLGLKCFATMKDELPGSARAGSMGLKTEADVDRYLAEEIRKVSSHPALLAWYVTDEPSAAQAQMLARRYRIFRRCDDQHPTWGVFCRLHDLREFVPACDVMGVDPYPVPLQPVSHVTDFVQGAKRELQMDRPMWNVPQMFSWDWFRKNKGEKERFPTEAELRSMVWQHIAGGARGLIGFSYQSLRNRTTPEEYARHWRAICSVYGEVVRFFPVLHSLERAEAVSCRDRGTVARSWSYRGELYVLACNTEPAARDVDIRISGMRRRIVGADAEVSARLEGGNSLKLHLPALGVAVVRLR